MYLLGNKDEVKLRAKERSSRRYIMMKLIYSVLSLPLIHAVHEYLLFCMDFTTILRKYDDP